MHCSLLLGWADWWMWREGGKSIKSIIVVSSWDSTLLREIWAVNHQQLLYSQLVKSPTKGKHFLKKFSKHSKEEAAKSSSSRRLVKAASFFQPSCDWTQSHSHTVTLWHSEVWFATTITGLAKAHLGSITWAFACFLQQLRLPTQSQVLLRGVWPVPHSQLSELELNPDKRSCPR